MGDEETLPVTPKHDFSVNIEDIMHTAYLQYSLSVNVGRAIPDVRDGLKPCNRRILYAMRQLGLTKGHATVKCAKVVGEVLGNYHPHGDSSVYDTLVRMAQDFSMRYILVEGQGNFGSIDGDPPAAYRYTECRMERLTEELLADIEKETVNMLPTFDEQTMEPEVLPCKFPNLLVNGGMGIGVGMASSIPTHNLGEVINATVYLLEHPAATTRELMQYLPGPDFPTGGIICGVDEIRKLYDTGHGVLKIRAKAEIVEKNGKEQIIVTEIPYALNKELLVKRIAELVSDKTITGISGLRDESTDKDDTRKSSKKGPGIRIVIDVKHGAMANVVLNQLYSHTQMESAFGCNMLVVDHNRPRVMNLSQVLQAYLDHRFDVVTRRAQYELKKAQARAHILEGLLIAVHNLDDVVRIIRESRTRDEAHSSLIARFNLSKIQANAILDMRLHQLTGLAVKDLQEEYDDVCKTIAYLNEFLQNREMRVAKIKEELLYVKERYADARKTEITYDQGDLNYADLIPRHSCVITVSDSGYIKRVPADTYQTQHRGGKGIIGMGTKEEDNVAHLFNADSHDIIFFITNRGIMHWLNVYDIPEGVRTGKGRAIVNLLPKIGQGEQVRAMLTVRQDMFENPDYSIVMATKNGVVKRTALKCFKNLRKVGIRALSIKEDDDLIAAAVSDGSSEVILATALGMACRFHEKQVRSMGRDAAGVIGIKFKLNGDSVIGMEIVPAETEAPDLPETEDGLISENAVSDTDTGVEVPDEPEDAAAEEEAEAAAEEEAASEAETETEEEIAEDDGKPQLLVVTSGGMGKRSYVEGYRLTKRGAKGVKNMNLSEKETVVAAIRVLHDDEILLTTKRGQITRISVSEIRLVGRNSKGVRIMNLKKDDAIIGASRIVQVDAQPSKESDIPTEFFASAGNGAGNVPENADEDEYYDVEAETENTGSAADSDNGGNGEE